MQIKTFFFTIATFTLLALTACQDAPPKHGEGKEFNSAYVCPMHDKGSGGDQPGKCPVCGMDYVKMEEHVKDGHKH